MTAIRRTRFAAAKDGLAANLSWGVWDQLAKTWAIDPKLSKECASSRAEAMNAAARGGGYQ